MAFNLSVTAQELNSAVVKANAAAPQSTTYNKDEVDSALSGKAAASHTHTMSQITDLGTAAAKGFDAAPTSGHTDYAVSSDGVYATMNPSQFSSISAVSGMVSNITGGYAKIGKFVILNVRCTVTTGFSASWTIFASGLPQPLLDSATSVVAVMNNQDADIVITNDGRIASNSAITSNAALVLSAVYVSK